MKRLAGLAVTAALILPALGASTINMRPAHPVAGFRCWIEVNAALPGGTEKICQAVR